MNNTILFTKHILYSTYLSIYLREKWQRIKYKLTLILMIWRGNLQILNLKDWQSLLYNY